MVLFLGRLSLGTICCHCLYVVIYLAAFWCSAPLGQPFRPSAPVFQCCHIECFSFVWTSAHHRSITMATQRTQRTCPGVEGKPCGSFVDILYSIYLAVSPILGDITKKATKTMGVLLRSSSNDEGPDRVWMALLEQHSPSSPVSHNLRRFTDAFSPTAPTTVLPIYGNPVATADASQNCVTIVRHSFLFLACSLASLISILLLLMLE